MVFHKNHCEAVSREQKSKRLIIDFNILIPDSGYWNPDSLPVELGFWIPIVSGIPDSLCCIPDSKPRISDSISKILSKSGFHIS